MTNFRKREGKALYKFFPKSDHEPKKVIFNTEVIEEIKKEIERLMG